MAGTGIDAPGLVLERWLTPIGPLVLVGEGSVLRIAEFEAAQKRLFATLRRHYGGAAVTEGRVAPGITDALRAYFAGQLGALDAVRVGPAGTPFQQQIWAALRGVQAGQTVAYGALAERLGLGRAAARAVGHANGANPVAVVIPCHRLLGADGSLTGYAGGLVRKRWLLDHEGAT